jgi:hypothetical protein
VSETLPRACGQNATRPSGSIARSIVAIVERTSRETRSSSAVAARIGVNGLSASDADASAICCSVQANG